MPVSIQLFGRQLEFSRKGIVLRPLSPRGNGWFPWGIVRESFTGAWQNNVELRLDQVVTNPTLFSCITLIAGDISKTCLRLVEEDDDGIWTETESPAFSPVLRKPNHYQTITKFVEHWMVSKLTQGNTYVLKKRDQRNVVTALYVLEPSRVIPLVTPMGDVYYQLTRDDLSGLSEPTVTVPASEIIHDRMVCLFHPLIGVTPIFACGAAAVQGLTIQANTNKLFSNGASPGGVLTAPGSISVETAQRLKEYWERNYTGDNVGKVAVLGDGLKFEGITQTAVDSQLIDQLQWSDERICSAYHVPAYLIGVGPPPPYANFEPLMQAYYSQCLQTHLTNFEKSLDEGLGIDEPVGGTQYGVEFDIDDLIWMDTATKTKAAADGIKGGGLSPDEARKKYYGLGPVDGGDTPYMQQQNFSLAALAERDSNDPFAKPAPAPAAPSASSQDAMAADQMSADQMAASLSDLLTKELELVA